MAVKKLRRMVKRLVYGKNRTDPPTEGELPVYMHPIEYSQMLAVVEALAPRRVLEWGSGGSTRALLEECPFVETYVSIEHNPEWHARVASLVDDPRLQLYHVELALPEPPYPSGDKELGRAYKEWMDLCERDPSAVADYVARPAELGLTFDFVLVDGRGRVHCLEAGWELLRPGGVLMIHDAQREIYHPTIESIGRAVFLEPWEQGQICFIRKPEA